MDYRIGIVGAGRMAQALGWLLRDRGEPVTAVASRNPDSAKQAVAFIGGEVQAVTLEKLMAQCSHVIIAVADQAVHATSEQLAETKITDRIILHTCGSKGPEVLQPLQVKGNSCGALHPLQTVPSPEKGVQALPGSFFAVAGDAPGVQWAERIISLLDGKILRVAADRWPLYHAAAVMASNYQMALLSAARDLMIAAGVSKAEALPALAPLAKASMENTFVLGPEQALTGPIRRGDTETVKTHLTAMTALSSDLRDLYASAALITLNLAKQQGLSTEAGGQIEKLLRDANKGT